MYIKLCFINPNHLPSSSSKEPLFSSAETMIMKVFDYENYLLK